MYGLTNNGDSENESESELELEEGARFMEIGPATFNPEDSFLTSHLPL